jgi:hypothetical protein
MKGGWVMCTMVPPTQIKPAYLGVYYARPEKVFEQGAFTNLLHSAYSDSQLRVIYKHRQRAKLSVSEQEELQRIGKTKRLKRSMADVPLWHDTDEVEPPEEIDLPDLSDLVLEMRVRILTPDGEVCLEPHEYSIIDDLQPYLDEIGEGYFMRELGGIKSAKKLQEQLFYVMQRGIPRTTAYKLVLGEIERPNVFWLEPHPGLQAYFSRGAFSR